MKPTVARFRRLIGEYAVVHRDSVLIKLLAQNLLDCSPEFLYLYVDLMSQGVFKPCVCMCLFMCEYMCVGMCVYIKAQCVPTVNDLNHEICLCTALASCM